MSTLLESLRLENSFVPYGNPATLSKDGTTLTYAAHKTLDKVAYYAKNLFLLAPRAFFVPIRIAYAYLGYLAAKVTWWRSSPTPNFPELTEDQVAEALPNQFGPSDSLFQSCGYGTKYSNKPGRSNWNSTKNENWLTTKHIKVENERHFATFFIDYLDRPDEFVRILREMNVNAYRFSLERSIIETSPGVFNDETIQKHHTLIQRLIDAGITPWVTLHHFVETEDSPGFTDPTKLEAFENYCLRMIDEFNEVDHWMTFNEPGVYATQSFVRGVYPPGVTGDFATAGKVIRNLLITHCKIYKKAKQAHPGKKIGITHQWLKFAPINPDNPLEKYICDSISRIYHKCIYNFFKTGKFKFEVPFLASEEFQVDDWNPKEWLDFIGVQFYGYPQFKAGFSIGKTYPGDNVKQFLGLAIGATCREDSRVLSFGPAFSPETLDDALQEAVDIGVDVAITETGSDTKVQRHGNAQVVDDPKSQREYYERILPILHKFKDRMIGFFYWTLRSNLEWENADKVNLGVSTFTEDLHGRLQIQPNTAGRYLQEICHTNLQRVGNLLADNAA